MSHPDATPQWRTKWLMATRWEIAGSDPLAFHDPDQSRSVVIKEKPVSGVLDAISLAPCSVTLLAPDME